MESLLDESLSILLSLLPAVDVCHVDACGLRLHQVARCNAVWEALCSDLWHGRAVLRRFHQLRVQGEAREAYKESMRDAERTEITRGELLSIRWCFRFKSSAGESWQENDPWWQGSKATRVRFLANGRAKFLGRRLFGGRPPTLRWRLVRFRERVQRALNRHAGSFEDFSDFGVRGVRAEVMGRAVPTYCVRRNKENWGWSMESCWVVWSSWPMPLRHSAEAAQLAEERLPVTFEVQESEAIAFNTGRHTDEEEVDEDQCDSEDGQEVVVPEDWVVEEEEEAEDAESESEPDNTPYLVVRIGERLIRLPRVLVETTPPELLELMLRRSLEALEPEQ